MHLTPIFQSSALDNAVGTQVFLKCESFQVGGAFKFRGAYNALSQISDARRPRGVVAYSSGNHAQAVARAGQMLGIPVTVVMPDGSSETKRQATQGYGAKVVRCPVSEREEVARQLQQDTGATLIPPFDHPEVICGQGTLALEMLEQLPDLLAVLAPVGGGGLISGVAIALKALNPKCEVVGVEPAQCDDAARSLASGRIETCDSCASIADGTRTRSLGRITFPIVRRFVDRIVTVSEEAIAEAVRFLFYRMKLVVEPSGALGVAALMSGSYKCSGNTGVVISGGNVDGSLMASILTSAAPRGD